MTSTISDVDLCFIKEEIFDKKPNVIGWSNTYHPKVVNGKPINVDSLRIYVEKKVPVAELYETHVIPETASSGVKIDVIEIGHIKALSSAKGRRQIVRPLVGGVSIGNGAITDGTLGWFYKNKKGTIFMGSNAHVFTPNAGWEVKQVLKSGKIYELQPGIYDGGTLADITGTYKWHKRIYGSSHVLSDSSLGNGLAKLYNGISSRLGKLTRLMAYVPTLATQNTIDFSYASIDVEWKPELFGNIDLSNIEGFLGHLFAGSDTTTIICKATNIVPIAKVAQLTHLIKYQSMESGRK